VRHKNYAKEKLNEFTKTCKNMKKNILPESLLWNVFIATHDWLLGCDPAVKYEVHTWNRPW